MDKVFYAGKTIFEAFVQDLLSVSINLPLALYLVYTKYLFNMVPAYIISRRVERLRIDGYLNTLDAWDPGGIPSTDEIWGTLSVRKAHPSLETYSYKCAAGLKTLLVEYLLMQNRNLTGEEKNPKTREEMREVNGGMPLLTDLCLAMRSDPLGVIRGLGEVVTCIYGPP